MYRNVSLFLSAGLVSALLFSLVQPSHAAIRPSFSLDYCSWHASDIVLVQVTERPGVFRILESWKGASEPGDALSVPDLQPPASAVGISSYPKQVEDLWRSKLAEQIPAQPVGSWMVLFLKKGARTSAEQWEPADQFGNMKTSAVWIDGGQLYTFFQVMNPGPSIFVHWYRSFDRMKERISEIRAVQLEMAKVVANEDLAARAEGLKVYARSDMLEAQQLAVSELAKCGPEAVATIRELLYDPAFNEEDAELVTVFADAGGESVGEELNARLQDQLRFWQAIAPTLPIGWWNRDVTPHSRLSKRYRRTLGLVLALEPLHYRPALATAEQLGSLWRSLPQLNDANGLNQMATECDKLVAALQPN